MGVILHAWTTPEISDDDDGGAHVRWGATASITYWRLLLVSRESHAQLRAIAAAPPHTDTARPARGSACLLGRLERSGDQIGGHATPILRIRSHIVDRRDLGRK